MRKFLIAIGLLCFVSAVYAAAPGPVTSTNVSGTIAVTNTFQSIVASNPFLKGCLIQNTGANMEFVYFGPIGGATKPKSFQLRPPGTGVQGGAISCATQTGEVIIDQISITGTAGDTFTAAYQQ